jgi:hypothetical protein
MSDFPILCAAPVVRNLLAGRQTQDRRPAWTFHDVGDNHTKRPTPWQRVNPGDRLWVRETWGCPSADHPYVVDGRKPQPEDRIVWKAEPADAWQWRTGHPGCGEFVWRPSIHMPRWASRLTLIVTAAKIELVQVALTFTVHKQNIDALRASPLDHDGGVR